MYQFCYVINILPSCLTVKLVQLLLVHWRLPLYITQTVHWHVHFNLDVDWALLLLILLLKRSSKLNGNALQSLRLGRSWKTSRAGGVWSRCSALSAVTRQHGQRRELPVHCVTDSAPPDHEETLSVPCTGVRYLKQYRKQRQIFQTLITSA